MGRPRLHRPIQYLIDMTESIAFSPLFQWIPILKGLVSGGFLTSGILAPFGFIIQAPLFVIGTLIFFDAVIPRDKEISIIATLITMALSGFVSIMGIVFGFVHIWVIIIVVIAAAVYGSALTKRKQ